jgi:hypothetical protein
MYLISLLEPVRAPEHPTALVPYRALNDPISPGSELAYKSRIPSGTGGLYDRTSVILTGLTSPALHDSWELFRVYPGNRTFMKLTVAQYGVGIYTQPSLSVAYEYWPRWYSGILGGPEGQWYRLVNSAVASTLDNHYTSVDATNRWGLNDRFEVDIQYTTSSGLFRFRLRTRTTTPFVYTSRVEATLEIWGDQVRPVAASGVKMPNAGSIPSWYWRTDSDEVWYSPTLLNGWVNYGDVFSTARFIRLISGQVLLRGLIRAGTLNQPAFLLPSTFRPATTFQHHTNAAPNPGNGFVTVYSDGNVVAGVSNTGTVTDHFSLDGITFKASVP